MTKEELADDYTRRMCDIELKDVNEYTMKVRNAYLDGFINGERNVRDRLIRIVQPPKDTDAIYLDTICLIGEIE